MNFRTVPKALILLFRMTCGEAWNEIMSDYEVAEPSCVRGSNFFDSDCGSETYARALFVSWNILSMYIFVSMVRFLLIIWGSRWESNITAVYLAHLRKFQLRVSALWRLIGCFARRTPEVQAGMGQIRSGWDGLHP